MMGAESMLTSETASEIQPQAVPNASKRIGLIKDLLDWFSENKDEIDEDTWLSLVTGLEEQLKELEADY